MNDIPYYPWDEGEKLYASALNAAIANSGRGYSGASNIKDFGAKGDGIADDTAAIISAIGTGGRLVSFPPGTYKITSTIVLPSYTTLQGAGSGLSVIRPGPFPNPCFWSTNWFNRISLPNWQGPPPWPPTTPANQTDMHITLKGLAFDFSQNRMTQTSTMPGQGICQFLLAQDISIDDVRAYTGLPGGDTVGFFGFQLMGCDNVRITNYVATNVTNALDCWKGPTRLRVSSCLFESNDHPANGALINYNAIGSPSDYYQNDDLKVINTTFWLHAAVAIYLDPAGGGSSTNNVAVNNCEIVCKPSASGVESVGIMGRGPGNNVQLSNIVIRAENGVIVREAIELSAFYGNVGAPPTTAGMISTQAGSPTLTINMAPTGTDVGPGNFVLIDNGSGGNVVGNGLTLNGFYPVTGVSGPTGPGTPPYQSGTIVTATATANATATGPINVATHVTGYWGSMNNCEISNIVCDGLAGVASNYLINLHGSGHRVNGVTVTQNYGGAAGPAYLGVVGINSTTDHSHPFRKSQVANIIAAPGVGALPAGYSGDNIVMWTNQGPWPDTSMTPGIRFSSTAVASSNTDLSHHIDLDGGTIGINVNPSGSLNFVGSSSGISFTVLGAVTGYVGTDGLNNMAVGQTYRQPGTFTSLTAYGQMSFNNATAVSLASFNPLPVSAANDATAAGAGIAVGGLYRNGSILMVRTV
jgi:hypothetical protein